MKELVSKWNKISLVKRILVGLIIGIILALLAPKAASPVVILGSLFVGALKAVAPILVFFLVMTATGNATISCCGKTLEPLVAKKAEEGHKLEIEPVEDELYVTTEHEMKKEHYISFIAYVKGDRALITKQYPEWNMQFRFRKSGHGKLYYYCTNHGLFYQIV